MVHDPEMCLNMMNGFNIQFHFHRIYGVVKLRCYLHTGLYQIAERRPDTLRLPESSRPSER
jgi:hypothetical protein